MKYLLSVDGGGTKTEFSVSSLQGEIIQNFYSGSSNYKSVGLENTYNHFIEGLAQVKETLKIDLEDIAYSVWGISGCDCENDLNLIREVIEKTGMNSNKFYLCNDAVLAFYAQAEEPGVVIISGTGSIALGIGIDGTIERRGGWGYNISDIGSGHWIGNEALKRVLLYCDGCVKYSPLYKKILEYFNLENFEELPYAITEVTDFFEIAKLARIVVEASGEGIEEARDILRQGSIVLTQMVEQIAKKLEFEHCEYINIVLSGGVFKNESYQEIFKEELEKKIGNANIKYVFQVNAPSFGGIRLAKKMLAKGE